MSASVAAALLLAQISIPIGPTPRRNERIRAPLSEYGPLWAAECGDSTDWDKAAPPVRIHGNTYVVGTCGISAILIAGSEGHVLIDSGTETGADLVAANIRFLGYRLEDIRFILHSHEHLDHVGGVARLLQLTGATLVASAPAARVFATGVNGADDPQAGQLKPFRAAPVGRIVGDGDVVRLRDIQLTAIATPGHTPGALSWTWESCDGGVCRTMLFADSLSPVSGPDYKFSAHPAYLAAYRASLARIAAQRCEILLTPHPAASALKERITGKAPLFDASACKAFAARQSKALDDRLAKERGE